MICTKRQIIEIISRQWFIDDGVKNDRRFIDSLCSKLNDRMVLKLAKDSGLVIDKVKYGVFVLNQDLK